MSVLRVFSLCVLHVFISLVSVCLVHVFVCIVCLLLCVCSCAFVLCVHCVFCVSMHCVALRARCVCARAFIPRVCV